MKRIALLNPIVPHYREEFYRKLSERYPLDVFVYEPDLGNRGGFSLSTFPITPLKSISFLKQRFIAYDIRPFLSSRYDTIVLMLHFGHLSTWLLLLLNVFFRKRIILWGQGISIKRYLKEIRKPSLPLRLMLGLSNGAWIYTEPEAALWGDRFPRKPIRAINNTISGVTDILNNEISASKETLKAHFGITEPLCFIFCARFNNPFRRVDLLLETIAKLDGNTYGFIIIGDGALKPDFSEFDNVYDFGAVYDEKTKSHLFHIADIYFQPGWIGLSVVEAMAYGKPVLTFRRSDQTLQCVEYHYIQDGVNGYIVDDMDGLLRRVRDTPEAAWAALGNTSRELVAKTLGMEQMVDRAAEVIEAV